MSNFPHAHLGETEIILVPLSCPQCERVMGRYLPSILYIGDLNITKLFVANCNHCSHRIRWVPVKVADGGTQAIDKEK
jgi:hypothetical protein